MKPNSSFRWLIAIVVTAMTILLIGGVWFYRVQQQGLQQQAEDELQGVAQLKADQIVAWRAERLGDAAFITESPLLAEGVVRWLANPQAGDNTSILAEFRALQKHYDYHNVDLVDVDGTVLLSLNGDKGLIHEVDQKVLAAALLNGQSMLTDLHPGSGDLPPHIEAIAPLFASADPSTEPIGAIILQSDASQFLYPLIQTWPSPSRSAETLLVRREGDSVLFLNELRYQKGSALTLLLPLAQIDLPAVKAVEGYEGATQGKDYRGVEVVAAVEAIPDSPWFIVSKMDRDEIFADWQIYSRLILALILGAMVTVGIAGGTAWQRNQLLHYQKLYQVEKTHQETEARYQTILMSIGDGVIVSDANGRVLFLNPMAETLTGWAQNDASGKLLEEIFRIVNEETRQPVDNPVHRVMHEGTVVGLANHTLLITEEGREIPIIESGAPIHDVSGTLIGAVLVFRDQTEERAAQKALERSESFLRNILDNLPIGVAVNSVFPEVAFSYVNDGFLKCYRTTRESLAEPDSFWEAAYQDAEYREVIRSKILEDIASGDPARMHWEDIAITREGEETTFVSARNTPLQGTQLMLSVVWDTTERNRAEDKLRESEERFRQAVTDAPFPMLIHAEDGEIVVLNQVWTEITGYTHADIPTVDAWTERAYHKNQQIVQEDINRLYGMQGRRDEGEYAITTHSGEQRIWAFSSSPAGRLPDGRWLVLSMAMDVTKRKHAEAMLRQQNQYLLSLQKTSFDLISELDLDQLLENIVRRAADLAGTSAALLNLIDPETNRLSSKVSMGVLANSLKSEVRPGKGLVGIVWQTGQPLIVEDYDNWQERIDNFSHNAIRSIIGVPLVLDAEVKGVLSLAYDTHTEGTFGPETLEILTQFAQLAAVAIQNAQLFSRVEQELSERKRAEETVRRYAERLAVTNRLERIIASRLDVTKIYDEFVNELLTLIPLDRTAIVLLNDDREHWYIVRQWTQHEPKFAPEVKRPVKGSVIQWLVSHRTPLLENEIGEHGDWPETELLRREGIQSRLLLPLMIKEQVIGVFTAASSQANAISEEDQDLLKTIAYQLAVAIQNTRLYAEVQRHTTDLEQRVAERTAQLEASNQELEAFSYSVSHDLRAPLRAMDGFSRILIEDYAPELPDEAQRYLNMVRRNAQQMGSLIDHLLTFSRLGRQPLNKELTKPGELVESILVDLNLDLEARDISLVIGDLPPCQADPALLRQVFANLIENAVKFTKKRESASIEIGCQQKNQKHVYYVKDNGSGFDMRYAPKLFGVFQRLHRAEDYEGTGVGLATVQRIIHRHGGRIWAEAEVDQGATFYFTLDDIGEAPDDNQ